MYIKCKKNVSVRNGYLLCLWNELFAQQVGTLRKVPVEESRIMITHPLELGPILGIRNEEVPTVLFKQHKEVYVLKKVVHYNDIKKPD